MAKTKTRTRTLTEAQERKLNDIPQRYHGTYKKAVRGNVSVAIRLHCLECCGWSPSEVQLCTAAGCVFYPKRMG